MDLTFDEGVLSDVVVDICRVFGYKTDDLSAGQLLDICSILNAYGDSRLLDYALTSVDKLLNEIL